MSNMILLPNPYGATRSSGKLSAQTRKKKGGGFRTHKAVLASNEPPPLHQRKGEPMDGFTADALGTGSTTSKATKDGRILPDYLEEPSRSKRPRQARKVISSMPRSR